MYGSPSPSYLVLSINLPLSSYSMRHRAQRFFEMVKYVGFVRASGAITGDEVFFGVHSSPHIGASRLK